MAAGAPSPASGRAQLWAQSSRDAALALLQSFVANDATLAELQHALAARPARTHRDSIRLGELLVRPAATAAGATAAAATTAGARCAAAAAAAPPATPRRGARTTEMRAMLVTILRRHDGGMTSTALGALLKREGMFATGAQVNALLRAAQEAGDIVALGGRPKVWRAQLRGRSVPEPVVIRKAVDIRRAQEAAAAPPAPAAAQQAPATLPPVDQTDIQAVAAILRKRFFAPQKAAGDEA